MAQNIRAEALAALSRQFAILHAVTVGTLSPEDRAVAELELGRSIPSPLRTLSQIATWAAIVGLGNEDAIEFRLRYRIDPAFRAKQIQRAHRKAAQRRDLAFLGTISAEENRQLFSVKDCLYCGEPMASGDKTLDHIWPVKLGGLHVATNCVVVCRRCNTSKGGKSPDAWLLRLPQDRRDLVRAHFQKLGIWGRRAAA